MINITLFVQIAHFIAAYFLLKEILLKKALFFIEKEQQIYDSLKAEIQKQEHHLKEQEDVKNTQQRSFMYSLRQLSPSFKKEFIQFTTPSLHPLELTPQEKEQLAHYMAQKLVKQVLHD